jgi:acetolactate synthase regulatory subunit
MQWLITLDTDNDSITLCRLMNTFRRKGLKIATLAVSSRPGGYTLMAVVDSPESEVEHIFHLLRCTEGVQHVTYYQHEPSADASFLFVDSDSGTSSIAQILAAFPGSRLIFASHGKYLLEIPTEIRPRSVSVGPGEPAYLPFARVKTTRNVGSPELVGAQV